MRSRLRHCQMQLVTVPTFVALGITLGATVAGRGNVRKHLCQGLLPLARKRDSLAGARTSTQWGRPRFFARAWVGVEQGGHIALHRFDIPLCATRSFANGHRTGTAEHFEQLPTFFGQHAPQ